MLMCQSPMAVLRLNCVAPRQIITPHFCLGQFTLYPSLARVRNERTWSLAARYLFFDQASNRK